MTLGSLFDGSGGFPLGGMLCGIEPRWASEIEPFPIRVTTKRIPQMRHIGDIARIDGGKIEPVDIITFGSPCQDMSIAGTRQGLSGSRSGLFFQAIRIIREMRKETNGEYPKYCVWENVLGALSSNGGEDFRCVLEALCRTAEDGIHVPRPPGRWKKAGEIVGNHFSLAYRVFNSMGWGVPQKRRRIFLVTDFGGGGAGEILLNSKGVSWTSEHSFGKRQADAKGIPFGIGGTGRASPKTMKIRCGGGCGGKGVLIQDNLSATLACHRDQTLFVPQGDTYTARHLTPKECARLMGFSDDWCDGLGEAAPSETEVDRWTEIFEEYRKVVKPDTMPKSRAAVRKWLIDPYTDTAEYRLWGNGVVLPCVYFVLSGIKNYEYSRRNEHERA